MSPMTVISSLTNLPSSLKAGLEAGRLAPYLGPGLLALCAGVTPAAEPQTLAAALSSRVAVPGKIKNRLTAAAQFIENFKHRKTLVKAMNQIYARPAQASPLHRWLAALPAPLIVDTWYDDTLRGALQAQRSNWAEVRGITRIAQPLSEAAALLCAAPSPA